MRILNAHVRYRQWGGEDRVAQLEERLLTESGAEVRLHLVGPVTSYDALALIGILANPGARRGAGSAGFERVIEEFSPDIVHVHNLFPLLGVGALEAVRSVGVPIIHTIHNYRYSCLSGTHFYDGEICELCGPCNFRAGIRRRCYRNSRAQSRMMAAMLSDYWRFAVSEAGVDRFLVLTPFAARRMADAGVAPERIVVKPNSVDAASTTLEWNKRSGVVFLGRLSKEKGIAPLVHAWSERLPVLTVVGDGPEMHAMAAMASSNIRVAGHQLTDQARESIRSARVLVLPSLWYEGGFPLVAMEALSEGTPVVAFDLGSMADSLEPDTGGSCCPTGDFRALASRCEEIATLDELHWCELSTAARRHWAGEFANSVNVERLEELYGTVCRQRGMR